MQRPTTHGHLPSPPRQPHPPSYSINLGYQPADSDTDDAMTGRAGYENVAFTGASGDSDATVHFTGNY